MVAPEELLSSSQQRRDAAPLSQAVGLVSSPFSCEQPLRGALGWPCPSDKQHVGLEQGECPRVFFGFS